MRSSRALVKKRILSMAELLFTKIHDSRILSSENLHPSLITLSTELEDPISSLLKSEILTCCKHSLYNIPAQKNRPSASVVKIQVSMGFRDSENSKFCDMGSTSHKSKELALNFFPSSCTPATANREHSFCQ